MYDDVTYVYDDVTHWLGCPWKAMSVKSALPVIANEAPSVSPVRV